MSSGPLALLIRVLLSCHITWLVVMTGVDGRGQCGGVGGVRGVGGGDWDGGEGGQEGPVRWVGWGGVSWGCRAVIFWSSRKVYGGGVTGGVTPWAADVSADPGLIFGEAASQSWW